LDPTALKAGQTGAINPNAPVGGPGGYTYQSVPIDSPQAAALQNQGYRIVTTSPNQGTVMFEIPKVPGTISQQPSGEEGFFNYSASMGSSGAPGTNKGAVSDLVGGDATAKSGNIYGEKLPDGRTAIYSYGEHFPMAIVNNEDNTAVINMDKYSPTTSGHQSMLSSELANQGITTTPSTTGDLINTIKEAKGGAAPVIAPSDPPVVNMMDNDGNPLMKKGDFTLKWNSTDAWRGYYDAVPSKGSGWQKLDSNWMTGNWEDAGDNAANVVQKNLAELHAKVQAAGGKMTVVTAPTSNVFSTGYDVFVKGLSKQAFDDLSGAVKSTGFANLNTPTGAGNINMIPTWNQQTTTPEVVRAFLGTAGLGAAPFAGMAAGKAIGNAVRSKVQPFINRLGGAPAMTPMMSRAIPIQPMLGNK
jgi:hypothetical protein